MKTKQEIIEKLDKAFDFLKKYPHANISNHLDRLFEQLEECEDD